MTMKTTIAMLLGTCLLLWGCDDTSKKKEGCGNGLLDLGEECDGGELQGASCASLGYYNALGVLACSADCHYDVSDCGGRCGDVTIDAENGETCDDANLNGQTCQSLGYSGGILACDAGCQFDTAECTTLCGNGIIEGDETCDDANAIDMDGCDASCDVEVGWSCTGTPSLCEPACGDDLVVGDEACDGDNLDGQTCVTLGFVSGTLTCNGSCGFDTSGCTME